MLGNTYPIFDSIGRTNAWTRSPDMETYLRLEFKPADRSGVRAAIREQVRQARARDGIVRSRLLRRFRTWVRRLRVPAEIAVAVVVRDPSARDEDRRSA